MTTPKLLVLFIWVNPVANSTSVQIYVKTSALPQTRSLVNTPFLKSFLSAFVRRYPTNIKVEHSSNVLFYLSYSRAVWFQGFHCYKSILMNEIQFGIRNKLFLSFWIAQNWFSFPTKTLYSTDSKVFVPHDCFLRVYLFHYTTEE